MVTGGGLPVGRQQGGQVAHVAVPVIVGAAGEGGGVAGAGLGGGGGVGVGGGGGGGIGGSGRMQSLLHGNVNVLLGGAMLGGLILVLVLVCYCCHRGMRKSDEEREEEEEEERERRRRLEREWAEECMGGDGCGAGGMVPGTDITGIRSLEEIGIVGTPRPLFNNNLELQQCYEGSGVFYMSEDPRTCPEFDDVFSVPIPPPSYEVAVGKWEEAVAEGTTPVTDEGAVGGTIESSNLPIDSSGLPSYEAALKLEAQGYV